MSITVCEPAVWEPPTGRPAATRGWVVHDGPVTWVLDTVVGGLHVWRSVGAGDTIWQAEWHEYDGTIIRLPHPRATRGKAEWDLHRLIRMYRDQRAADVLRRRIRRYT